MIITPIKLSKLFDLTVLLFLFLTLIQEVYPLSKIRNDNYLEAREGDGNVVHIREDDTFEPVGRSKLKMDDEFVQLSGRMSDFMFEAHPIIDKLSDFYKKNEDVYEIKRLEAEFMQLKKVHQYDQLVSDFVTYFKKHWV